MLPRSFVFFDDIQKVYTGLRGRSWQVAAFWLFRFAVEGFKLRPERVLRLPEGVPLSGGCEDALVGEELSSEGRVGVDDGPEAGCVTQSLF